jgi:hypothetical protein
MIEHDLSSAQRDELGEMQSLIERLERYDVSEPDTTRLLAALTPLLDKQRSELLPAGEVNLVQRRGWRGWLHVAWAQMSLIEAPFWWASLLVMAIGVLLSVGVGGAEATLCLLVLSPLIAVAAVAYLFRPATRTLWEFEQLSQVQPLEFLYIRLALIFALTGIIAAILLLVVGVQGLQIVLWRLLLIWAGPMMGMVGIALFCSVRWNNSASIIAPTLTWGLLILVGWRDTVLATAMAFPNASTIVAHLNLSNTIPVLAVVVLMSGLFLIYESGRVLTR